MKKVLFVCDGMEFSEGAFKAARWLNNQQPILLTGMFMPQVSLANYWSYAHGMGGPDVLSLASGESKESLLKNIRNFEELCQMNGIAYTVHHEYTDFAIPELKIETRFADLLLLASERFYRNILGKEDMEYIAEALHESECPVWVVPEKFDILATNVILYNGTASSVYAIKQFAYLFPELCIRDTTVLYLAQEDGAPLPHELELKELVEQHFPNVAIKKADVADIGLDTWLTGKENTLVITGSFGRSSLSQWIRKSFVQNIIAQHKLSVFTAHR